MLPEPIVCAACAASALRIILSFCISGLIFQWRKRREHDHWLFPPSARNARKKLTEFFNRSVRIVLTEFCHIILQYVTDFSPPICHKCGKNWQNWPKSSVKYFATMSKKRQTKAKKIGQKCWVWKQQYKTECKWSFSAFLNQMQQSRIW
jgi:hypothetical protein